MTKFPALAAAVAILSLPASAAAASSGGIVLTANSHRHALQVVDGNHVVHAFHFGGKLSRVGLGTRVRFVAHGSAIKHLAVRHARARTVVFLGRIVRISPSGVVLRLADRRLLRLPGKRVHLPAAGPQPLSAGVVVLVRLTVGSSRVPRSVALSPVSSTSETGTPELSGTVIEVDSDALVIQSADGSQQRVTVAASVISSLHVALCDTVSITYHHVGPTIVADTVKAVDLNAIAACNGSSDTGGSSAGGQDVVGTITRLSLMSVVISTPSGSESLAATSDLTDGFIVGDQVDVTYNQPGGMMTANDIEYYGQDAVGSVIYVDSGTIRISDPTTGQITTFTDDPANGSFDGVAQGDQVDISFHLSSGRQIVDSVSDITNPG